MLANYLSKHELSMRTLSLTKKLSRYSYCHSIFLLTLILCAALYWKGLNGPFVLDDFNSIVYALDGNYSFDRFLEFAFNNQSGLLGRPISMASLFVSGWVHGVSSWGFKLHNLLTHLSISLLVFWWVKLVAGYDIKSKSLVTQFSLLAAAIWLLMPIQVSTVLYPVQRMAQLSTLFILLAMIIYIYAVFSISIKKKLLLYFVALPAATLLAIFSKENGVLILPMLAVLAIFYRHKMLKIDRLFAFYLIVVPILATCLVIAVYIDKFTNYSSRSFSLTERLLTEVDVIWLYLYTLFVPDINKMSLMLDDFPIRESIDLIWAVKFTALAVILISGVVLLFRRSLVGVGIVVFFIGHSLESTFIPLEIAFEHRNYLPSVGMVIVLVALLFEVEKYFNSKYIKSIYLIVLVVTLYFRVDAWSSEDKLYLTQLESRPFSKRAQITYAKYLFKKQQYQEALNQAARGKEIHPNYAGFNLIEIDMVSQLQAFDDSLIDQAVKNLKLNPVDGGEIKTLTLMSNCKLANHCNYLSFPQFHRLVDQALATSKQKGGAYIDHLELIKARMYYKEKHYGIMETYYINAYRHNSDPVMIIEMIGALWNSGQRQKARDYLQDVESGKYFSVLTNKERINKLKSVIK